MFFLPEIEGRIKDGERKKKRLSLVRGIHGQMKREAFSLKRRTRSLLESTVLCGSYNGQQSLIYPLQGLCWIYVFAGQFTWGTPNNWVGERGVHKTCGGSKECAIWAKWIVFYLSQRLLSAHDDDAIMYLFNLAEPLNLHKKKKVKRLR